MQYFNEGKQHESYRNQCPQDRTLTLQLPLNIQPGQYHIFVIIEHQQTEIKGEIVKQQMISKSVAWSKERRTTDIHAAVVAYAMQHAGTDMDLDSALEETGIECLNKC